MSQRTIATGSNIPLTADAPDEYVVKTGDTLWDISKVFLRDPWYWPEIWYVNPQVENPHLIYPGDVLKLVYVDGQPRLTLAEGAQRRRRQASVPEVRRDPLSQAITAIPYDIIASFMGRPTLLDKDQVKSAPYVVAMRDGHLIGASATNSTRAASKTPLPTPATASSTWRSSCAIPRTTTCSAIRACTSALVRSRRRAIRRSSF